MAMRSSRSLSPGRDCRNSGGGAINVSFTGGVAPYTYSWTGPMGFSSSAQNLRNVSAGTYMLVLADNSMPPYRDTFEYEVSGSFGAPDAVIRTPGVISCAQTSILLDGLGSSQGNNITFEWSTTDGNLSGGTNTLTPTVDDGGGV